MDCQFVKQQNAAAEADVENFLDNALRKKMRFFFFYLRNTSKTLEINASLPAKKIK